MKPTRLLAGLRARPTSPFAASLSSLSGPTFKSLCAHSFRAPDHVPLIFFWFFFFLHRRYKAGRPTFPCWKTPDIDIWRIQVIKASSSVPEMPHKKGERKRSRLWSAVIMQRSITVRLESEKTPHLCVPSTCFSLYWYTSSPTGLCASIMSCVMY